METASRGTQDGQLVPQRLPSSSSLPGAQRGLSNLPKTSDIEHRSLTLTLKRKHVRKGRIQGKDICRTRCPSSCADTCC